MVQGEALLEGRRPAPYRRRPLLEPGDQRFALLNIHCAKKETILNYLCLTPFSCTFKKYTYSLLEEIHEGRE
jgi:hypothetical protein